MGLTLLRAYEDEIKSQDYGRVSGRTRQASAEWRALSASGGALAFFDYIYHLVVFATFTHRLGESYAIGQGAETVVARAARGAQAVCTLLGGPATGTPGRTGCVIGGGVCSFVR